MLLHPLLGPIMPGTAFCIAAALVEYFCGLAPALTVMVVGMGIADYLFVPPTPPSPYSIAVTSRC